MLPTQPETIREYIVLLLAEFPVATADWLFETICNDFQECTERAVFKELKKLQEMDVVIKAGSSYSLRLAWVHELIRFSEDIFKHYQQKGTLLESILTEEESESRWRFNDLRRLDDFWIQVALTLFAHTGKSKMFYWIRNSWFHLAHPQKESQFQDALMKQGLRLYMILGESTYLDRLVSRQWPHEVYEYSFASSPFDKEKASSITVVGDYIVTIMIEPTLRKNISALYERVIDSSSFTVTNIKELFETQGKCTLRLQNSPRKALKLKKKFARFFGVNIEEF